MHPSQFKQLMGTLRAQSDATKEGFKEQKDSAAKTYQSAEKKMGEIPGVILAVINASHEDFKAYIRSERQKEKAQRRLDYKFQSRILYATIATAIFTGGAFFAAVWYASIARGQLDQMITATNASISAANAAADSYESTYGPKGQVERMMGQTVPQTTAQIRAADAAKKAASISDKTLHISQQARIVIGTPTIIILGQYDPTFVSIPLLNIGQLATRGLSLSYMEVTTNVTSRKDIADKQSRGELLPIQPLSTYPPYKFDNYAYCSGGGPFPDISQRGTDFSANIPITVINPSELSKGKQAVFVSGDASYNDGFREDGKTYEHFCYFTHPQFGGTFSACGEMEERIFTKAVITQAKSRKCQQ